MKATETKNSAALINFNNTPDFASYYKNKVVIITGASMGIGKELAFQILKFGGNVVITGRSIERLLAVRKEFSEYENNLLIHAGDITDFTSNEEMMNKTIARFGRLDVLINNAGLSCFGEVGNMNVNTAKQIIDTNIYGSLYPVMAALPELKKTKGAILFISSIAGIHGLPGYSAYSLSKMSLKALAQSLYAELKFENVFVGISYVGFTENEETKKTMTPDGQWVNVPKRPKLFTNSRQKTVLTLLKQIKNKKHSDVQTFVGNFTNKFNQFFPNVLSALLKLNYSRSVRQA